MLAYRRLKVHEKAFTLGLRVNEFLEGPAFERRYWFKDQISRAAWSISGNIAEGNGRSTPLDYAAFLDRARGSAFELDNWLCAAAASGWCSEQQQQQFERDIDEISAMLFTMAAQLRKKRSLESRNGP